MQVEASTHGISFSHPILGLRTGVNGAVGPVLAQTAQITSITAETENPTPSMAYCQGLSRSPGPRRIALDQHNMARMALAAMQASALNNALILIRGARLTRSNIVNGRAPNLPNACRNVIGFPCRRDFRTNRFALIKIHMPITETSEATPAFRKRRMERASCATPLPET